MATAARSILNGGGKKKTKKRCTALVIGECGMGKSTVVYNLAGRPKLKSMIDGMDPNGVTKDFEAFNANLRGAGLVDLALDSPGLGDQDVKLPEWIGKAERSFKEVDAIIVCVSETNPRITMGAELVTMMVKRGFLGHLRGDDNETRSLLQDSIIVAGTKGNLATKKLRKAMPTIAASFAKKCGLEAVTYIPMDACGWEEPDDREETPVVNLKKLQAHLASLKKKNDALPKSKSKLAYKEIKETEMIDMACNVMGIKVDDETRRAMAKELGFWRNLLRGITSLFSLKKATREKTLMHLSRVGKSITSTVSGMAEDIWDIFRSMTWAEIEEYNSTGYEDFITNGAM